MSGEVYDPGQFDGGAITSDAEGLLLREMEKATGIIAQFKNCFTDYRDPELREHAVSELVASRMYGMAFGYEDLNDHEELPRSVFFPSGAATVATLPSSLLI